MKVLYSLEPDFYIINPKILVNFNKDVILPKYFYTQLTHLSQGSFQNATDAATLIINSLSKWAESDILIFKTVAGGTVYFTDEAANCGSFDNSYENLDIRNPLDRYLLSLLKLSETLEAKIVFLASSPEVIRKCRTLNFEVATLEEFSTPGESWLRPEMLVNIQASIPDTTSEPEPLANQEQVTAPDPAPSVEIQWRDIRVARQASNIEWIDLNPFQVL